MPTKPLLIHIGYQKASSTFLQDRVFMHPSLGFWPVFPTKIDRARLNELLVYVAAFSYDKGPFQQAVSSAIAAMPNERLVPVVSAESMVGMPFDANAGCTRLVADRLIETFPQAKILMIVREQNSIIMSSYLQYVRAGGIRSVERFVPQPAQIEDEARWTGAQLPFFAYDNLVSYYQDRLGKDRVLALPFELLKHDARDYVARISAFAEADIDLDKVDLSPVKEAIPANIIFIRRLANALISLDEDNPMAYLMPRNVYWRIARYPKLWIDALGRRFDDKAARRRLAQRIDARVGDYYRASNRRLAELSGFDVASLGYKT